MCTLMQKDVLIENLAETSAFIGMRFKGVEHIPLEFSMCGLLMYFILPHDALSQQKHLLLMQIDYSAWSAHRVRSSAQP